MAAKKFSLKDNPIFESTVVPIKKDRKKHPLDTIYPVRDKGQKTEAPEALPISNGVYSPSEKRKTNIDKIKEGLTKKIDRKVLFLGAVTVITALFFLAYPTFRTVSRIDYPAPSVAEAISPPVVKPYPLTGQAQEVRVPPVLEQVKQAQPEELLLELAVIEVSPPQVEEKLSLAPQRKLGDERWLLSAIIFDGANSSALVNHRIVRKDDTLLGGEVKVGEITPNSVILIRGEETFTLKLTE